MTESTAGSAAESRFQRALRARYQLQRADQERRHRSSKEFNDATIVQEWRSKRGNTTMLPAANEAATTCGARGGCTWQEAMAVLFAAHTAGAPTGLPQPLSAGEKWLKPTQEMNASLPAADSECQRIDGSKLSPAEFLRLVRGSHPVVIEGLLTGWLAMQRWSMRHLLERARNSTVKVYASPDEEFEAVVRASDPIASGQPACMGCRPEEVCSLPREPRLALCNYCRLHFRFLAL